MGSFGIQLKEPSFVAHQIRTFRDDVSSKHSMSACVPVSFIHLGSPETSLNTALGYWSLENVLYGRFLLLEPPSRDTPFEQLVQFRIRSTLCFWDGEPDEYGKERSEWAKEESYF